MANFSSYNRDSQSSYTDDDDDIEIERGVDDAHTQIGSQSYDHEIESHIDTEQE